MKKAAFIFAIILISCFILSACGAKNNDIVGTWVTDSLEISGMKYNVTFVFKKDGTGSLTISSGGGDTIQYTAKDGKLKITGERTNIDGTYTIEGDKLKLESEHMTTTMTRKK